MPSLPLTVRTLLWLRLTDGTVHLLDWNLVTHQTLGQMVEPRCLTKQTGNIQDEDLFGSSFSGIQVAPAVPTGVYVLDQALSSAQWPHYRSTDPGVQ